MNIQDELRDITPPMKQVVRTAENAVIRRAIWSLPKPVIWVLVTVVVVLSAMYGNK
jgi:hypothetical protein